MSTQSPQKVVVVGGGFAGINFARHMVNDKNYEVTLVDKNNYNFFPPLLYQVSTGFLDPADISYPFRKLFRNNRLKIRMGEVQHIDLENHVCLLDNGALQYDRLVFACGAKTNFFGNKQVEANSIPMKTVEDALKMRNTLFSTMEKAAIAATPEERRKLLTIVVAGAGATGVEVAGMLAEMKNYIIKKDYPEFADATEGIHLVDGGATVLAPMSEKTHQKAYEVLCKLGVNVILNTHVADYDGSVVKFTNGDEIVTSTLIWATGITANTFEGIPETSLGKGKRMMTDEFNQVIGLPDVYAIGDIALMTSDKNFPNGHPQQAQPAIQQGRHLAKNFRAIATGKPAKSFIYNDKGSMAIIGRNNAVVDLLKNKTHLNGPLALFIWLFVHLMSLVNYRNKLKTLYNWIASYISKDQAMRMIFKEAD